jgi:hypothetical protein
MKMVLKMFLQQVTDGHMIIHDLNWTLIEKYVAENLHLDHGYVRQLRKNWFEDGDIMISECSGNVDSPDKMDELDDDDDDDEEGGSTKQKLTHVELQSLIKKIDLVHAEGETITRNKLRCFLKQKQCVSASKSTINSYMRKTGMLYSPIAKKVRNTGAYWMDLLRDCLIKFDKLVTGMKEEECNYVLTFTGESYCYQNHAQKNSLAESSTEKFILSQ